MTQYTFGKFTTFIYSYLMALASISKLYRRYTNDTFSRRIFLILTIFRYCRIRYINEHLPLCITYSASGWPFCMINEYPHKMWINFLFYPTTNKTDISILSTPWLPTRLSPLSAFILSHSCVMLTLLLDYRYFTHDPTLHYVAATAKFISILYYPRFPMYTTYFVQTLLGWIWYNPY